MSPKASFLASPAAAGCLALLSVVFAIVGTACLAVAWTTGARDAQPVVPKSASAEPATAPMSDPSPTRAAPDESAGDDQRSNDPAAASTAPPPANDRDGFLGKLKSFADKAKSETHKRTAGGPAAGEYSCFVNAGSPQQIFVQRFRVDGDTYRDLSFEKGSGDFDYDANDGAMTFTSGPFKDRYLGVFVAAGKTIKQSSRFTYRYTYRPAKSDTIHLLDPKTDYGSKIVFGIYCSRKK